ncbi:MAG: outer membrane lipoprotein carrier protein LolA [Candidatus Omnitrophota bacterium]
MLRIIMMLIVCVGCIVSDSARAADDLAAALAGITQEMASLKSVQVDFVQEKKMAVFSSTIVLRGTLAWERPDSLAWHIASPIQYAFIMRGGLVRQWEGEHNTVQEFNMNANPMMRVASQQIQRWFSGKYDQLAREYDVALVSGKPLVLACVPHPNSPEAGFVARVSIQFREDLRYIEKITIEEMSGDQTSIQFENARLNETIPVDAWRAGLVSPHG